MNADALTTDALKHDPRTKLIKKYLDNGWRGVKIGRDFSTLYPDPVYARRDFF